MKQKEYIGKLRSRLAFVLPQNELDDIVSDMKEIFSDGLSDGKSEEQICSSLGSPKEAAENILSERGVHFSPKGAFIKAAAFAVLTALSMWYLWKDTFGSMFIMPLVPLVLSLLTESGKPSEITKKKPSLWGIASCTFAITAVLLFSKLCDAVIESDNAALFPLGAAITVVTAVSLISVLLSSKTEPYAFIPRTVLSLCIVIYQIYAAFHITDMVIDIDTGTDMVIQQMAFRAKYLNIFITTLFGADIIIFVLSAFRRDRASAPCMYAALGSLMLLCRERHILRSLDITAKIEPVLNYVPLSLWAEVCAMIILSVILTAYPNARGAKKNG